MVRRRRGDSVLLLVSSARLGAPQENALRNGESLR